MPPLWCPLRDSRRRRLAGVTPAAGRLIAEPVSAALFYFDHAKALEPAGLRE
jgi:hypothetical protein